MTNEYKELWDALGEYLERESERSSEISVSRVRTMMELLVKARIG